MNMYKNLLFLSLIMLLPSSLLVAMQDAKARAEAKVAAEQVAGLNPDPLPRIYFALADAADQQIDISEAVAAQVGLYNADLNLREINLRAYIDRNPTCTIADVRRLVAGLEDPVRLNDYSLAQLIELAKLSTYAGCEQLSQRLIALLPQKAVAYLTAGNNNTPLQEVIRLLGGNLNGNLFESLGENNSALLKQSCLQLTNNWDPKKIDTGASQQLLQEIFLSQTNFHNTQGSLMSLAPHGRYLAIVAVRPGALRQGEPHPDDSANLYLYEKIDNEWRLRYEQPFFSDRNISYAWSADGSKFALCCFRQLHLIERTPENGFAAHRINIEWVGQPMDLYRRGASLSWAPDNNGLIVRLHGNFRQGVQNDQYAQITKQADGTWLVALQQADALDLANRRFVDKEVPKTDNLGLIEFATHPMADRILGYPMAGMYYVNQKGKLLRELSVNELLFIAAYQHMRRANPARELTQAEKQIVNDLLAAKPVVGAAIVKENIPTATQQATHHLFNKYPKTCMFLSVCAAIVAVKVLNKGMNKAWEFRKKLKWPSMPAWFNRLFRRQPAPVK